MIWGDHKSRYTHSHMLTAIIIVIIIIIFIMASHLPLYECLTLDTFLSQPIVRNAIE